jgi:hypothetical protein
MPASSLHQQNFRYLEDLRSCAHAKQRLEPLANGKTPAQIQLKRNVLKQLKDISTVNVLKSATELDWRDEMAAMYEALSRHKYCRDRTTDTTEALVTQICLSEITRNDEMGLKIALLILIHIHQKPNDAGVIRSWRHVEVDVFRQR